jgi:16S rRNA (adenine1518-N6/adenine1519-N6)-dimethyltransferase
MSTGRRTPAPRAAATKRPARKRFGQHFLEVPWVEKVMRAIAPSNTETFLEIGPGRGALTRPLAAAARHVLAFEVDRDMAADLMAAAVPRLTVVSGDFLAVTAAGLREEITRAGLVPAYLRAAGNLPYNIASPILFKLVELHGAGVALTDATVMLQREVADRLLARPHTRDYGVLSVLIGHRAHVQRLLDLPPGAFRPPPKVRSTLVKLVFHAPDPPPLSPGGFEALVQAVFTRRRKTLANALTAYGGAGSPERALARAGIDGRRRPETLDIAEFVRLSDAIEGAAQT